MSRFFLSDDAKRDLAKLDLYLDGLPGAPARAIAAEVFHLLHSIGSAPYLGVGHSDLTRAFGEEIRSGVAAPYRIYYRLGRTYPEVLAVLHGSRDQRTEMLRLVQ